MLGGGLALNKDTAASMANSMEVPQKINISSTMIFSISTSEYSSEENEVTISKRYPWELVMDREAWHATVHEVAKSWTGLSD